MVLKLKTDEIGKYPQREILNPLEASHDQFWAALFHNLHLDHRFDEIARTISCWKESGAPSKSRPFGMHRMF